MAPRLFRRHSEAVLDGSHECFFGVTHFRKSDSATPKPADPFTGKVNLTRYENNPPEVRATLPKPKPRSIDRPLADYPAVRNAQRPDYVRHRRMAR